MQKPKLSMYWAASCGGCEIALVNLHEKILDLDRAFNFMFCPCLLDTKKQDVEALPEGDIALTLFNGAIRTEENREMARLMRKKSRILIAFGACACGGAIPALGNLSDRDEIVHAIYLDNPSTHNPAGLVPRQKTQVPEGVIHLPPLLEKVRTLADEVAVDYFIPGCPPEPDRIWDVVDLLIQGKPLPPAGTVLGAREVSLCQECNRKKSEKKISKFYRTYELVPDGETCLLEQGIVCMGIATAGGCGALCPQVNMPCTGCYGPPEGTTDQVLDASGLKCPQPTLKITSLSMKMKPGDVLEVHADRPTFEKDLKQWCLRFRKVLLWMRDEGLVRKCQIQF